MTEQQQRQSIDVKIPLFNLVEIPTEEYQSLLEIAQSARILASGQEREPYYEAEWARLDSEIKRWIDLPEKKLEPMDLTVARTLNGINLILKYEPSAQIAATHEILYFGSYKTREKMTPHEQVQMEEWGWFQEFESWAKCT